MNVIYGITNCSTVKKARAWLAENNIDYHFHDYRKDGLTPAMLEKFSSALGWEALLNRSGMTWRKLAEADKANLDQDRALRLMLTYPAVIRRPLLEINGAKNFHPGFSEAAYKNLFTLQE